MSRYLCITFLPLAFHIQKHLFPRVFYLIWFLYKINSLSLQIQILFSSLPFVFPQSFPFLLFFNFSFSSLLLSLPHVSFLPNPLISFFPFPSLIAEGWVNQASQMITHHLHCSMKILLYLFSSHLLSLHHRKYLSVFYAYPLYV